MKIPNDKWFGALRVRHSRRHYDARNIEADVEVLLLDFIDELNLRSDEFRAVLVKDDPHEIFKGGIGSYGKIKQAPAYIAFVGDMSVPNIQEITGFLGECVVLEATSLGLATCWVGGLFDRKVVATQVGLLPREQVLAVTPVGYAKKDYDLEERLMSRLAGSHKRKSLSELCTGLPEKAWPHWIKMGLEAARLAPSATNRQPWRFKVSTDSVIVTVDNKYFAFNISKRLDCGIAMLHFHVGALYAGQSGSWEYLKEPDVARFILIE